MKVLLIQHEGAGGGAIAAEELVRTIEKTGRKVRDLTRKKATPKAIEKAEPDLVAVAGGDGTVAAILAMLPDRSIPVAIIPTGTANNIARSLGIDGEPEALVAAWDLERRLRFDIGNAHCPWGCRHFAEGVGFGAFADSLRRAPSVDGAEKLGAGREALGEALRESAPLPLEIAIDGAQLPGDLLLAEVMNVRLTGPRLALAPGADAGDGRLQVAYLGKADRAAMRKWLGDGGKGRPPTRQRGGREVVVRGGGAMMRIDDECCWLEPESEVMVRIEGEPVQVLAPPEAPALAG